MVLRCDPKRTSNRRKKNDIVDFTRMKTFCALKYTLKKTKKQIIEWEKMLAKHLCDKGIVSEA